MVTKTIQILGLILLFGFLCSASCEKPERQCTRHYRFEEAISIYPAKDTFQLGDTFFIEVNTPTNMHDLAENTHIELIDHGITTFIHMFQILPQDSNRHFYPGHPGYEGAMDPNANGKFDYSNEKGKWNVIGKFGVAMEYDTINSNFVHKTAIIVKDTGLFYFHIFDALYFYVYTESRRPNLTDTECTQYWDKMKLTVNDGNTNIYLLEDRGMTFRVGPATNGETDLHNCKHGSWSFVVVPKSTP